MRIVLVNARADAEQNPGGDTVQVAKTRAALTDLGVEVDVRSPERLESLQGWNLVHVFNLQSPETATRIFQIAAAEKLPVVLSPIYWEEYELWYGMARESSRMWRRMRRAAGEPLTRHTYVAWQQLKERSRSTWRHQRSLLQAASAVLPNSHTEAAMLRRAFSLDGDFPDKVQVVPNGIDPSLYAVPPQPDEAFAARHGVRDFILEVATVYPVKNQLAVMEALYDLPLPIVFVGHAHPAFQAYAAECRKRADERGKVVLVDHVPHGDLPGIYALAKVHVLPSWRETPGLASLEAAAAGCNVVTTSIGSTAEYFGDRAWYCHPGDPNSIRAAVLSALATSPSVDLRNHVLHRFTWQRAAEATSEAYARVVSAVATSGPPDIHGRRRPSLAQVGSDLGSGRKAAETNSV